MGIKDNFQQALRELTGTDKEEAKREKQIDVMKSAVTAGDTGEFDAIRGGNDGSSFEEIERRAAAAADEYSRQQSAYTGGVVHIKGDDFDDVPPMPQDYVAPTPVEEMQNINNGAAPAESVPEPAPSEQVQAPGTAAPQQPNMNMGYQQQPNMNMGYQQPNMNMGYQQQPNMNMGYQQQPNMNMGYQQQPNMNMGYQQQPNMNMGYHQQSNMNMGYQQQSNMNMGYQQQPDPTYRRPGDSGYSSGNTATAGDPANDKSRIFAAARYQHPMNEEDEITVISKNTVIDGNIRSFANMSVDGNIKGNIETTKDIDLNGKIVGNIACNNAQMRTSQVQGNIQMKGNAYMERDTLLIGDLTSTYANVNGKIKGNLDITGKAELKSDAVVFGDISASTITVNDGAIIQGYVSTTFLNKEESKNIFPDTITIGD